MVGEAEAASEAEVAPEAPGAADAVGIAPEDHVDAADGPTSDVRRPEAPERVGARPPAGSPDPRGELLEAGASDGGGDGAAVGRDHKLVAGEWQAVICPPIMKVRAASARLENA